MKCPLCSCALRLVGWRSNAEPIYLHQELIGFSRGDSEASFACSRCNIEVKVTGYQNVNKAMGARV